MKKKDIQAIVKIRNSKTKEEMIHKISMYLKSSCSVLVAKYYYQIYGFEGCDLNYKTKEMGKKDTTGIGCIPPGTELEGK